MGLKHIGILGMRWGRKKGKTQTKQKQSRSSDYREVTSLRSKGIKNLSNDQINTILKRMTLEKQIKDMNMAQIQRGEAIVRSIINVGASAKMVYDMAQSPFGQAIRNRLVRST